MRCRLLQPYAAALTEVPRALARQGAIYVPAYSTLSAIAGLTKVNFAVTLSIRNPSATRTLVVRHIAFFNTIGEELQVYLTQPVGLRPFGTVNLFIPVQDQRGGAGGNFLVEWAAEAEAPDLLVEAIMLGEMGGSSYSFISRGLEIGAANTEN